MEKNHPTICYISSKKPKMRWDGKPIFTITGIEIYKNAPDSERYLDQPIINNPLINTEDFNPDFLLSFADRLKAKDIPFPEIIRQRTIETIYDLFINNHTPRMYHEKVSKFAKVIFKDNSEPETYRLSPTLFFKSFAKKQVLAFDVHDLLQHPLQMEAWPKQFSYVTMNAYLACELSKKDPKYLRLKKLGIFIWNVCFEESLITLENELISFGCLNWLAPSETPFNRIENFRSCTVEEQKIGFKWHYVDALKELYKLESKFAQSLNQELNWLKKLGYDADDEFMNLVRSTSSKPFENLDFRDVLKFKITTPKSPEELFDNAIKLIQEEL